MTGAFVLLTLLIAGVCIYMAGHAQHWFEHTITIKLQLPDDGCHGLNPGAAVMVMGTEAGEVTEISISADDRMTASMAVRQDFARFIGTGSRATIKKTLGMAGDAFVEISGSRGQPLPTDALIETIVDRDYNEMLLDIEKLVTSAKTALTTIENTVKDANVPAVTSEALNLFAETRQTNAYIQQLLVTRDSKQTPTNITEVLDRLNLTLLRIDQLLSTQGPAINQTLMNLREASANIRDLTENLKSNPSQIIFSKPPTQPEKVR